MDQQHGAGDAAQRVDRGDVLKAKTDDPLHIGEDQIDQPAGQGQAAQIAAHQPFGMGEAGNADHRRRRLFPLGSSLLGFSPFIMAPLTQARGGQQNGGGPARMANQNDFAAVQLRALTQPVDGACGVCGEFRQARRPVAIAVAMIAHIEQKHIPALRQKRLGQRQHHFGVGPPAVSYDDHRRSGRVFRLPLRRYPPAMQGLAAFGPDPHIFMGPAFVERRRLLAKARRLEPPVHQHNEQNRHSGERQQDKNGNGNDVCKHVFQVNGFSCRTFRIHIYSLWPWSGPLGRL